MKGNLNNEQAIPITDVPHYVPVRQGKRVHNSTVYRWMTKGVRGRRLESFMVGGMRFTTVESIARFLNSKSCETLREVNIESNLEQEIENALREEGI